MVSGLWLDELILVARLPEGEVMDTDYQAHLGHDVVHETEAVVTTDVLVKIDGWELTPRREVNEEAYTNTAALWRTDCGHSLTGWA